MKTAILSTLITLAFPVAYLVIWAATHISSDRATGGQPHEGLISLAISLAIAFFGGLLVTLCLLKARRI